MREEDFVSVFVIVEKVDGVSLPVATRHNAEPALAHCVTLAGHTERMQEGAGKVETMSNGARYVFPNVEYMVHRVEDCQ